MQKLKDMKKIPTKNYIILLVLFLGAFLLTYYIYRWYVVYSEYQNNIPIIRDSLTEITTEEMQHYIQERPTTTIYICTASDTDCRSFEKKFKKLVEQKSLKEEIIYVNIEDSNKDNFITFFNTNYPYKRENLNKYPALIYFEDGEVEDILQATKDENLSLKNVNDFIKRNKINSNN